MTALTPSPVPIELLLEHRAWVRVLARRLVEGEEGADDVEQQTWLAALRSPPHGIDSVRGWLATVVRNVVRKRQRSATRRRYHAGLWARRSARVEAVPSAAATAARAETAQKLVAAVMELDEPYRGTVLLRFFEGLPPREVARRMQIPVETVRTRQRRALARLRKRLDDDYGHRESWGLALLPLIGTEVDAPPVGAGRRGPAVTSGAWILMSILTKKTLVAAVIVAVLATGAAVWNGTESGDSDELPLSEDVAAAPDERAGATRRVLRPRRADELPQEGAPTHERDPDREASSSPPPSVEVRVRRADGGSSRGTSVVVWGPTIDPTLHGPAESDGVLSVPATDATRWLVTAVPGMPLVLTKLPAGTEPFEVDVPAGRVLAGLVRVDGRKPTGTLRLGLTGDGPWSVWSEVPEAAWDLLGPLGVRPTGLSTTTSHDGRFQFAGLPAGVTARLVAPRGYVLRDGGGLTLEVEIPDQAVTLELHRLPRITGRIVRPDGSAVPAAYASISFEGESRGSSFQPAGPDGRFEIELPPFTLTSLRLQVADARGLGRRELDLAVRGQVTRDLGDVVIDTVHELALRVVDASGSPVAGAVAVVQGPLRTLSSATGADGATTVRFSGDRAAVDVFALGHRPATRTLIAGRTDPVEVTLEAGTLLTLRIETDDTTPLDELSVRVTAAAQIFDGPGGRAYDESYYAAGGAATSSASYSDDATSVWFAPASDVMRIAGILPHVPLRVDLFDDMGVRLDGGKVRLEPAEHTTLRLRLPRVTHTVSGVVRDRTGTPLDRARVTIAAEGATSDDASAVSGPGKVLWTGKDGRFSLTGVRAPAVRLLVLRKGYVPWSRTNVRPRETKDALTVDLERGRTLSVTVVDRNGAPISDADVTADVPGLNVWSASVFLWVGEPSEDGAHKIHDLPASGEVVVTVEADGLKSRTITCGEAATCRIVLDR